MPRRLPVAIREHPEEHFLLAAMRVEPGVRPHVSVSRQLKVDLRTAKTWLDRLAPRIQQEQDKLRLQVAQTMKTDEEKQAQQEVLLARLASANAAKVQGAALELAPAMGKLAKDIARAMSDGTIQIRDPEEALRLLSRYVRIVEGSAEASLRSMEIERLRVGAPDRRRVDLHVHHEPPVFDPDEAARDAALLSDHVEQAKRAALEAHLTVSDAVEQAKLAARGTPSA